MVIPKKQLKSEEKKKDSSIPGSSEAEDEEEEIAVDSEQKKGNEWKHAYKIRFSGNPWTTLTRPEKSL